MVPTRPIRDVRRHSIDARVMSGRPSQIVRLRGDEVRTEEDL
jgi:hypothetical protein